MPILGHECKRSNKTSWMQNVASQYTTAHSDLPVTDVIRTVVEEVQQVLTSEDDDSANVSGRSTLASVNAQSREPLDQLEHGAWLAELLRTRQKKAALIECLEARLLERRSSAVEDDRELRCLEIEKNRLAALEKSFASAWRRLQARKSNATDPRRFYDTAESLAGCRLASAALSRLLTLRLDLADAPRFVSEQTDRVISSISSASPSLRMVSIASCPRFRGVLTDDGLGSLKGLHSLSLKYCSNVTDKGVVTVIQASLTLSHHDLQFCVGVSDKTLFALRGNHILELNINRKHHQGGKYSYGPQCTDAGIDSLASKCTRLHTLHVQGYGPLDDHVRGKLTSVSFGALAKAPQLCPLHTQATHDCRHRSDCDAYLNLQAVLRARRDETSQTTRAPLKPALSSADPGNLIPVREE